MRFIRVMVTFFIVAVPLSAYVPRRISTPVGLVYERWAGTAFPITWRLNTTRGPNITGSRNLADVVRGAFQAWSSVATSRVALTEGLDTPVTNAAQDGINLVSFVPTVYSADAPSLTILYTASTATSSQFTGQIREADILFNPQALLSLEENVPSDRFDIQALVLHEVGHLLGLDHSGLFSAVMFPALTRGNSLPRSLSTDDILGISNLYPTPGFFAARGSISGLVRAPSGAVTGGAHVVVVDESGKPVVSTLSESDGTYFVRGLEPGNYSAYAEPFDEPAAFTTRFAVTSASPLTLTLNKTGGDNQTGTAGQTLAQPLEVTVFNSGGVPVPGTLVRFAATSGGGNVIPVQASTDAQGKARTTAYLGKAGPQTFVATAGSASATFAANATAAAVMSITFVEPASNAALGELTVNEGNTLQTQLRILDGSGAVRTDVPVNYSSLSPDIATISGTGLISGIKAGFSTLTVSAGGVVATATITVVQVNAGPAGEVSGVAIDSSKRLYLAAPLNHTILTAPNLAATPEIYAGIHQSPGLKDDVRLQSQFRNPSFLAVDPIDGSVYVSDSANNVIRKIKPGTGGRVETLAPGTTFNNPQGIAIDNAGNLWVADSGSHIIRRINLTTQTVDTVAGLMGVTGAQDGTGSQARFNSPAGIAFEPESIPQQLERFRTGGTAPPVSVLVADTGSGAIRRVKATGEVQTITTATTTSPLALEEDAKPSITGLTLTAFDSPTGIAVDPFGNIYFSEPNTSRVKVILRNGQVVSAAQSNTLQGPRGLIVTELGKVVVADSGRTAREIAYGKPEITSITPEPATGASVTIRGKNFSPETIVVVNGIVASGVLVKSTEEISATIPAVTGQISVSVVNRGGSQDVTPPQLTAFNLTPTTIDTTLGAADVTANFTITDELSGARSIHILFMSPSRNQYSRTFSHCGDTVCFDPAPSRTGSFVFTFPRFSEAGIWKIERVDVFDAVGNTRTFNTDQLAASGFPVNLQVTSQQDTTPPQLTAFSFSPAGINTTSASADVTATFTMTDNLSGAKSIHILFMSPSRNQHSRTFSHCGDTVCFDPAPSRTGSFVFTFPRFSEAGIWKIERVDVFDAVGNTRTFNTDQLAALGFPVDLQVTSQQDTTPPQLTAFSFSPAGINTTSASADVTATFTMTDELSGAKSIHILFMSPSRNQNSRTFSHCGDSVCFDPAATRTGTFVFTFPQFSETGFWSVERVDVFDAVGNTRMLNTSALANLGFPTELYVMDPATRPAVAAVSASSGSPGTTIPATLTGSNLAGITAVTFSGTGVTATIGAGGTTTSVPITIMIAAGTAIGSRTITVRTGSGISVPFSGFTVTAPQP